MAILTPTQLAALRQECARAAQVVTWDRPTVNAALQAIEDWFEANRAALGAAIEAAAPGAFTNAQKRALVKFWLFSKFGRE
jgi:hypothetical protein